MRLLFFFACDCGVTFLYCNIPVIKTAMKQQRSNIWHWPSLQAWRREIREHRQSAYRIEVNIKQILYYRSNDQCVTDTKSDFPGVCIRFACRLVKILRLRTLCYLQVLIQTKRKAVSLNTLSMWQLWMPETILIFFCLVRIAFGVDFWQGKCYNWGWNRATAIPLALDGGLR